MPFPVRILVATGFICTGAVLAVAAEKVVVHQMRRMFVPDRIVVPRGSLVRFVNDETLVHHAFVDTPGFAVDSGDIPPGQTATLLFDRSGRFTVRCAIHPQMSLDVEVTP